MPLYETKCKRCEKYDTALVKLKDLDGWFGECECGGIRERCIRTAPTIAIGRNDYSTQIDKMKRASKERFVKSGEMDQTRHKFGSEFDDSLVAAAAGRIKSGQGND